MVLSGTAEPVLGIKVINAAVSNPGRGLERASGIGMVFDPLTARPVMLAEVALISAIRTAAYTVLSARHVGPRSWSRLGLLGTGTQARTHLDLLATENPALTQVQVHDINPRRGAAFVAGPRPGTPQCVSASVTHRRRSPRTPRSSSP